jgi:glycosyltransferase involved in cell wall biosynthesis
MTHQRPTLSAANVLVIVPLFNEVGTIKQVVSGIKSFGYTCIAVDDGSTDGSYAILQEVGVKTLRLPFNSGVGAALRCGFRYAVENGYDAIVQCDADGQHNFGDIGKLIETANETAADMVIGSRFLLPEQKYSVGAKRKFAMVVLARLASLATDAPLTDTTSGFRLISQPLLKEFATKFPTYYLGDTYEAILSAGKSGYKIQETDVTMYPRPVGSSRTSAQKALTLVFKVVLLTITKGHFKIRASNQTQR